MSLNILLFNSRAKIIKKKTAPKCMFRCSVFVATVKLMLSVFITLDSESHIDSNGFWGVHYSVAYV